MPRHPSLNVVVHARLLQQFREVEHHEIMIANQLEGLPLVGQHDYLSYIDVMRGGGFDGLMAELRFDDL